MDTLTRLAKALGWSFCPLASAYSMEGGARDFLERLGLSLEDAPPEMEVLREPLDRLLTILEDHHELTAQELAALLEALASLFAALRQLDADPPPSIPAEARDSFVEDLVSRLLTDYLSGNEPQIWSLLTALGVATRAEIPASGSRLPFIRHRIAWRSLPDRIRDPIPALAETFGWRGGTLDWLQLLRIVVDVLMASGVEVTSHEPAAAALAGLREGALDPRALRRGVCAVFSKESLAPQAVHAAVALCHLPETDASKPGFALVPILDDLFRDAGCLPFGYRHELCFRGDATTLADAALAFRPGSPPELIAGLLSGSPVRSTIELSVELTLVDPDEPFLPAGLAGGQPL